MQGKKIRVNTDKTKVLVFHKGKAKKDYKFTYLGREIEIVKNFTYLGINFTSSGLFRANWETKKSSATIGANNVIQILSKSKSDTWSTKVELFQSLCSNILVYGSENWGLRFLQEIDSFQTSFYKKS